MALFLHPSVHLLSWDHHQTPLDPSSGGGGSGFVPGRQAPPPQQRLFALNNLVATLEHNVFRLHPRHSLLRTETGSEQRSSSSSGSSPADSATGEELEDGWERRMWGEAVGHLVCVINHRHPDLRALGLESLLKLTTLALQQSSG